MVGLRIYDVRRTYMLTLKICVLTFHGCVTVLHNGISPKQNGRYAMWPFVREFAKYMRTHARQRWSSRRMWMRDRNEKSLLEPIRGVFRNS